MRPRLYDMRVSVFYHIAKLVSTDWISQALRMISPISPDHMKLIKAKSGISSFWTISMMFGGSRDRENSRSCFTEAAKTSRRFGKRCYDRSGLPTGREELRASHKHTLAIFCG